MSLKPIDMQVAIAKTQQLPKTNEMTGDKFVTQEAFKHEMQKNADKQLTEVTDTEEMNKLIDENGHNKQENKSKKDREKEEEDLKRIAKEKERASEDFNRKVTNQGNLFDFKA